MSEAVATLLTLPLSVGGAAIAALMFGILFYCIDKAKKLAMTDHADFKVSMARSENARLAEEVRKLEQRIKALENDGSDFAGQLADRTDNLAP